MSDYTSTLLVSVATFLSVSALLIAIFAFRREVKSKSEGEKVSFEDTWSLSASLLSLVFSLIVIVTQPAGHLAGWLAGPFVVLVAYWIVRRFGN